MARSRTRQRREEPRGWRWFLAEFAVVAAGVLAALAAQQLAESLHERRVSGAAREAVLAELNVNVTNVSRRLPAEPCVKRRLEELRARMDDAGRSGLVPAVTGIGGPPNYVLYTQRWEAATAGGRTALLPTDEQRAIARVYATLARVADRQEDERHLWPKLNAASDLRALSPDMVYDQRLVLAEAKAADRWIVQGIEQARFFANGIGVKGDAKLMDPPDMRGGPTDIQICQPLQAVGAAGYAGPATNVRGRQKQVAP